MKLLSFLVVILCSFSKIVYAMPSYNNQSQKFNNSERYQNAQTTKPPTNKTFNYSTNAQQNESSYQQYNYADQNAVTQQTTSQTWEFNLSNNQLLNEDSLIPLPEIPEENLYDDFQPRQHIRTIKDQFSKQIDGFKNGILNIQNRIEDQTQLFRKDIQLFKSQKINKENFQTKISHDMCDLRKDIQKIEDLSRYGMIGTYPNIWQFIYDCSHKKINQDDLYFFQEQIDIIKDNFMKKQLELWNGTLRMKEQINGLSLIFMEMEKPTEQYQQTIIAMTSMHVLGLRREIHEFEKEIVDQVSGLNSDLKTLKKNINEAHFLDSHLHKMNQEKNFLRNEIQGLKEKLKVSRHRFRELQKTLKKLVREQQTDQEEKIKWLKHEQRNLNRDLEFEERSLIKMRKLFYQNEWKDLNDPHDLAI